MFLARNAQPTFAGIPTFMRAPYTEVGRLVNGAIAVVGIPYDISSNGRAGSRYGPRSLREASTRFASILSGNESIDCDTGGVIKFPGVNEAGVTDLGDIDVYPLDWNKTKDSIINGVYEICKAGAIPIILGGDHLLTYPSILGCKQAVYDSGKGNVGYIRLSSQLDLGTAHPILGTVWRGTTARNILEDKIVNASNMVWIGVNGYLPQEEVNLAKEMDVKVHTLKQVRRDGIEKVVMQGIEEASTGCSTVYLSIDMDVINGVYLHSMDIPSFQGLKHVEIKQAINILAKQKIGAVDVVGCNPISDYMGEGEVVSNFGSAVAFNFISGYLDLISSNEG